MNSNAIYRYDPENFSKQNGKFDPNESTCTRHENFDQSEPIIQDQADSLGFSRMDSGNQLTSTTNQDSGNFKKKRNLGCCSRSTRGDAPWRLYNTDR